MSTSGRPDLSSQMKSKKRAQKVSRNANLLYKMAEKAHARFGTFDDFRCRGWEIVILIIPISFSNSSTAVILTVQLEWWNYSEAHLDIWTLCDPSLWLFENLSTFLFQFSFQPRKENLRFPVGATWAKFGEEGILCKNIIHPFRRGNAVIQLQDN